MKVITPIKDCFKMGGCETVHKMVVDQPLLLVLDGTKVHVRDLMNAPLGVVGMPVAAWLPYRIRQGESWMASFRQECFNWMGIFDRGTPPLCTIWRDHGSPEEQLKREMRKVVSKMRKVTVQDDLVEVWHGR